MKVIKVGRNLYNFNIYYDFIYYENYKGEPFNDKIIVKKLDISGNKIEKIENLPEGLKILDISGNKIEKWKIYKKD